MPVKYNPQAECLVHRLLSFAIAFSGCGCLVTAFSLQPVALWQTAVVCASCSGLVCLMLTLPKGGWVLAGGVSLAAGHWLHAGTALPQLESLIYQISRFFNGKFGCGVLYWSSAPPEDIPVTQGLFVLGAITVLAVSWVLCRRKNAFFALAAGGFPLAVCMAADTAPHNACLICLFACLLLLLLTQPVRRRIPGSGFRAVALALVPVLLFSGLLFAGQPRQLPLTDIQQFFRELLSSFSVGQEEDLLWTENGAVDLGQAGPQDLPQYAVMDVMTDLTGTVYLRGQSLDTYDGKHWYASPQGGGNYFPTEHMEQTAAMKISMRMESWVEFVPYYLDSYPLEQGSIHSQKDEKHRQYKICTPIEGKRNLCQEVDWQDPMVQQCLTLPKDTQQAAAAVLRKLLGEKTDYEPEEIRDALRTFVPYSLDTPKMPDDRQDFAIWFLEGGTDTGYCVHFASAAVVLLRATGIPARYVTGYMFSSLGGKTTVRGYHAHAWAEYLDPDRGWVILDATPPASVSESENTQQATQIPAQPPTEWEEQPEPKKRGTSFLWLLPGGITAALAQYALRRMWRRKEKQPNWRALRLWKEAEILARLTKQPLPEHLEKLAEKAKFSQHILTSPELAEFDCWLKGARRALKKRPWPAVFFLRLIWAV